MVTRIDPRNKTAAMINDVRMNVSVADSDGSNERIHAPLTLADDEQVVCNAGGIRYAPMLLCCQSWMRLKAEQKRARA
jgi:hypothetical protein